MVKGKRMEPTVLKTNITVMEKIMIHTLTTKPLLDPRRKQRNLMICLRKKQRKD